MEIQLTPFNRLILRYQGLLMSKVSHPYVNLIPLPEGNETDDYHLLWLLQELLHNKETPVIEKYLCLGFIQGVIVMKCYSDLTQELIIFDDLFNSDTKSVTDNV